MNGFTSQTWTPVGEGFSYDLTMFSYIAAFSKVFVGSCISLVGADLHLHLKMIRMSF